MVGVHEVVPTGASCAHGAISLCGVFGCCDCSDVFECYSLSCSRLYMSVGVDVEPLKAMKEAIRMASRVATQDQLSEVERQQGLWGTASARDAQDPMELLEEKLASGKRAARFEPPLTGLVADVEAAKYPYGTPYDVDASEFDLVAKLEVKPAPVTPAPVPVKAVAAPKQARQSPKTSSASSKASPVSSRGGGVIADVMLDAIRRRDLPGDVRAEAVRLLSQGLALGDEELMQEALTVLITGQ